MNMSPAEAKGLSHMLIAGVEHEVQTTRKCIAAIPENQLDFKLGDKGRTTRELAWHLAAADTWFAADCRQCRSREAGDELHLFR